MANNHTARKKTRKYLFQKLFSDTYTVNNLESFSESFLIDAFDWDLDDAYFSEMEKIIKEKEAYLIEVLKKFAPKFEPSNMNLTYVLPIFIWASEMLYLTEEIPAKVSINEAVELSKYFWDDSSYKIVNGILNKLMLNYDEVKKEFEEKVFELDFSFFKK